MELSPLVQFERRGIFFPPERILCLHAVSIVGRQVVLPVQEGGIHRGCVCRAVWARVLLASCPLVDIFVVLSHILSLHLSPALVAWHLLPHVTSLRPDILLALEWAGCCAVNPHDEILQTELTDLKQKVDTEYDVIKILTERLETCETRLALQQTEITRNRGDIVSCQIKEDIISFSMGFKKPTRKHRALL